MPYISELLDNTVYDSSDIRVGKLQDILILRPQEGQFEPLEFLAIRENFGSRESFVPFSQVANFTGSQITLKGQFSKMAQAGRPPGGYIGLKKDVLDRQVVDISGTRVVRVNDLRIGVVNEKMCVLAIDSSFRGLLRRIGLGGDVWDKFAKVNLIDWRQAQLIDGASDVHVSEVAENLGHLHPADIANIVEDLDIKQGSKLLASLDDKEAAKVFEELDPQLQNIFVNYLGSEKVSRILSHLPTDEFVDLVKTFSTEEARQILSRIKNGRRGSVEKLLAYPDNTAGGLMSTEYVAARPDWTVGRVTEEIRNLSDSLRSIIYVYVTEEDGKFRGVVSLRRLLIASPEESMGALAKPLAAYASLKPRDKMSKIIQLMTRYNLYTSVVLDKDKKLVGVVTIDDVMRQQYPAA